MLLYRMLYLNDAGRVAGATFAAMDAHHATERAEDWAARWGAELLTVNRAPSRDPQPVRLPAQCGLFPA